MPSNINLKNNPVNQSTSLNILSSESTLSPNRKTLFKIAAAVLSVIAVIAIITTAVLGISALIPLGIATAAVLANVGLLIGYQCTRRSSISLDTKDRDLKKPTIDDDPDKGDKTPVYIHSQPQLPDIHPDIPPLPKGAIPDGTVSNSESFYALWNNYLLGQWELKADTSSVLQNTPFTINPKAAQKHHQLLQCKTTSTTPHKAFLLLSDISIENLAVLPKDPSIPNTSVITNAANAAIQAGLGGTNGVLTKAVSAECWQKTAEKGPLTPGQHSVAKWEDSTLMANSRSNTGEVPDYLAQLLGPAAAKYQNNIDYVLPIIKYAYLDFFKHVVLDLKCSVVQVPLLSSALYAPLSEPYRSNWVEGAKLAFVLALNEFMEETGAALDQDLVISLVNINSLSLDIMPNN